jgi:hypothetical protein
MRERSMAAAGDPALVRRMSKAIQKVLDLLITNLTSKSKAYKSKVSLPRLCSDSRRPLTSCAPADLEEVSWSSPGQTWS